MVALQDNQLRDWIRGIRVDDHQAFEAVYAHFHSQVYSFAYRFLRSPEDAEEIVQEVFVKVWLKRKKLKDDRSFQAYLFTITRNTIFNQKKKARYHQAYLQFVQHFSDHLSSSPETGFDARNLLLRLQDSIAALPTQRQKVFRMSREQFLSHKEIASQLGISEKTVEVHIRNASIQLRRVLKDWMS